MREITDVLINDGHVIFDGGMGTAIEISIKNSGAESVNEKLNLTHPAVIEEIHRGFLEAGCDIIETNTFGGDYLTLEDKGLGQLCHEINAQGALIAKKAAGEYSKYGKKRYVCGSVGPGRKYPVLGDGSFDELEKSYNKQIEGLLSGGVDMLGIETCQDPLQIKAVLSACDAIFREKKIKVPIIVLISPGVNCRTAAGMSCESFLGTFQSYPLFAVGLNCGFGPLQSEKPLEEMCGKSHFEIVYMPNAGLPRIDGLKVIYDCGPEEFADVVFRQSVKFGLRIVGGCCGTTFRHIEELRKRFEGVKIPARKIDLSHSLSSLYSAYRKKDLPKPFMISEKTSVSGSKKFKKAVEERNFPAIREIAVGEETKGAHCIDICLACPGRNEIEDYDAITAFLSGIMKVPVCADTFCEKSLEVFLKKYPGKPLVNSANIGDREKSDKIFELVKIFGASVVCILADEKGYAVGIERKIQTAEKIYSSAVGVHGVLPQDIFFDPLTFSLASGDPVTAASLKATIDSIGILKEKFPKSGVILGVSNVSFGFGRGQRRILNSVYFHLAVKSGLDAAITDIDSILPLSQIPAKIVKSAEKLILSDPEDYIQNLRMFLGEKIGGEANISASKCFLTDREKLFSSVIYGEDKDLDEIIGRLLLKMPADKILKEILLPSMKKVGEMFEKGETLLPFVMFSSGVMNKSLEILAPQSKSKTGNRKRKILLATVKGDIHDIGKNIVKIIMENSGIEVVDLGVDKTDEEIASAVRKHCPDCVGLSGLLVYSALYIKKVAEKFVAEGISVPIICGGAALCEQYAAELRKSLKKNIFFAGDAFAAMKIMESEL
ncbi:homocysteine S-methyltransferase family protein [candidate division WOR-3 bacterium]|nr:homocysteine S-methyltransferase family protein [candidate division WOR-3 bacterium]